MSAIVELTPGFTSYWARLHVQTYDVADLLVAGENVWARRAQRRLVPGPHRDLAVADSYGDTVAFLGQLARRRPVVATGASWQSATGAIVAADLMAGQREDRESQPTAWHRSPSWTTTSPASRRHRPRRLGASQELRPVAVRRLDADRQVVDLGQNINGWVRLTDLGPADTELTLVHGEALDAER